MTGRTGRGRAPCSPAVLAAAAWAVLFGLAGAYAAAGGSVGGGLVAPGLVAAFDRRDPGMVAALWTATLLKLADGVALPTADRVLVGAPRRLAGAGSLALAALLVAWGAAEGGAGALVLAGAIPPPDGWGDGAVAICYAAIWGPWWLLGAVLHLLAGRHLLQVRRADRSGPPAPHPSPIRGIALAPTPRGGNTGRAATREVSMPRTPAHHDLPTVTTVAELADVVRTPARAATGADGTTFVLREGESCFYVDEDGIAPLWKGQRFPITACISGWAMLHDAPVAVADIDLDDRVPRSAYRPTFVRSLLMVPVGRGRPAAAIGAYWARPHRATEAEQRRLLEVADAAARALDLIDLSTAPWAPDLSGR